MRLRSRWTADPGRRPVGPPASPQCACRGSAPAASFGIPHAGLSHDTAPGAGRPAVRRAAFHRTIGVGAGPAMLPHGSWLAPSFGGRTRRRSARLCVRSPRRPRRQPGPEALASSGGSFPACPGRPGIWTSPDFPPSPARACAPVHAGLACGNQCSPSDRLEQSMWRFVGRQRAQGLAATPALHGRSVHCGLHMPRQRPWSGFPIPSSAAGPDAAASPAPCARSCCARHAPPGVRIGLPGSATSRVCRDLGLLGGLGQLPSLVQGAAAVENTAATPNETPAPRGSPRLRHGCLWADQPLAA